MNQTNHPVAAALDIGSNTIKMLVVKKTADGLTWLAERTSETRISKGISRDYPKLTEESMKRALNVVTDLYQEMLDYHPSYTRIVATSAVRDAHNREDFCQRILSATGKTVDVISGEEEAQLIGRGVATDKKLQNQKEIMVFDLGGGSVECIYLKDRIIQWAESLQLGGVRLQEQFVSDPTRPLQEEEKKQVVETVYQQVRNIELRLDDPDKALIVGAGGTYVTSRAILAEQRSEEAANSSPFLTSTELSSLFNEVSGYNLEQRLQLPKLPPNRADVFPVTLLALITLGKWAGISNFYHCTHSLRWGVADQLLADYG